MLTPISLTYPRMSDHTRYMALCPQLMGSSLKEVQRAWVFDQLHQRLAPGAKVIDLGGSACELADVLSARFEMTVVDPHDGSGNGPKNPDAYRKRFPKLNIVQGFVGPQIELRDYDAVVSTGVIEHIADAAYPDTVAGIEKVLKPGGFSIHAIDFTVRGVRGFMERTGASVALFAQSHGHDLDVAHKRREMLDDVETYFLSAAMYLQWRKSRSWDEYPWRQVSSINVIVQRT